jgi:hypothetical protein
MRRKRSGKNQVRRFGVLALVLGTAVTAQAVVFGTPAHADTDVSVGSGGALYIFCGCGQKQQD